MAETPFEKYRTQFIQRHPHVTSVEDGAIVLEAAHGHAFRDPESKVPLEKGDVEALGVSAISSNREIIELLRKVLSQKVLPEMSAWRSRYLRSVQHREQVENLEERKASAAFAARNAIGEILKFCEEDEREFREMGIENPVWVKMLKWIRWWLGRK